MKILITGPGRHGKDTLAEYLSGLTGLTFQSSSEFMMPYIKPLVEKATGKTWVSDQAFYADRVNYRNQWMEAINKINREKGLAYLTRELFKKYDIYVGMRHRDEFWAAKNNGLFDLTIYVDAHHRIRTPDTSLTILPEWCDVTIDNNDDEVALARKAQRLSKLLKAYMTLENMNDNLKHEIYEDAKERLRAKAY